MTTITLPSPLSLGVESDIGVWGSYRITFDHNARTASWEASLYALAISDTVPYYLSKPSLTHPPTPSGDGYTTTSDLKSRSGSLAYEIGATYELPYVPHVFYATFPESSGAPALTTQGGAALPAGSWILFGAQAVQPSGTQEFYVGMLSPVHIGTPPPDWDGGGGGNEPPPDPTTAAYGLYLLYPLGEDSEGYGNGLFKLDDPPMTQSEGEAKGYKLVNFTGDHPSIFVVFG